MEGRCRERFRNFCSSYSSEDARAFTNEIFLKHHLPMLGFLFIGEKAALLWDNEKIPFPDEALRHGFKRAGSMLYDPVQVERVVRQHPEEFADWSADTDQEMQKLGDFNDPNSVVRFGLLLGFPKESVMQYENQKTQYIWVLVNVFNILKAENPAELAALEELDNAHDIHAQCSWYERIITRYQQLIGIADDEMPSVLSEIRMLFNRHHVDVHGMTWVDPLPNDESIKRQQALRHAYQESGLVAVIEPLQRAGGVRLYQESVRSSVKDAVMSEQPGNSADG